MKKAMLVLAALITCCLAQPKQCQGAAYAYVANRDEGTVTVIRISDNRVLGTIDLESSDPIGVAVTPDGTHVYVTNRGDSNVSVIRTSDNTVVDTIDVGEKPFGVAVNPVSALVYVANRADGEVSVVKMDTEIDTIIVENGPVGVGVAVTPNGAFVYVANRAENTVSIIQASDDTIFDTIDVGNKPAGVAVTPDGKYVYVTNRDHGTVSVILTSPLPAVTGLPIRVGTMPFGLVVIPDGTHVYVANSDDDTVSVIQTSDNTVVDTIDAGISPFGVAVTPDGSRVYVTNSGDNTVSVIQTSDHTVSQINGVATPRSLGQFIASISVPEVPSDLTASTESDSQIDLSWSDNSFDELGFKIERKGQSENIFIEIDDVDANVTSYSNGDLLPDTTYSYRVRAYNNHGNSDSSDEAEATTGIILDPPTDLTATGVSHSRIRLSWEDNSFGESGVEIWRLKEVSEETDSGTDTETSDDATDENSGETTSETISGGTYTKIAEVGADVTGYSDDDLEPYTTYRYRVRAYDDAGGLSGYSNEVEKRTKDDCFIATAAYGSLMEPRVVTLRHFRDAYLIPHALGRVFVRTYYATSPPIANYISRHETLRAAVRAGLLPLVAFSYSMLHVGLTLTLTILVFIALSPVGLHWLCQRKKRSHKTAI
jgi:YVTN family beta-propeller protein